MCVCVYDVGDRTQIPQQTCGGERAALWNMFFLPSSHGLQKSNSVYKNEEQVPLASLAILVVLEQQLLQIAQDVCDHTFYW